MSSAGMHQCDECLTLHSSQLAAEECGDQDSADVARQRTWMEDHASE